MDVFQVTKDQIKTVQFKALANLNFITDGRGTHHNHPVLAPNIRPLIDAHLLSFPQYEVHYSRAKLNEFYLSSDLNLDRMFRLFVEMHPNLPNPGTHENTYRQRFRALGLRIGEPRTDTCKLCDKIKIDLTVARRNNNQNQIQVQIYERQWHLGLVDFTKMQMDGDFNRSRNDPTYAVLCIDLQQVCFCHHFCCTLSPNIFLY